ncbi:hypothetical protein HMPREF1548_02413 [Clostridium sp. KLE 1755]|nr:hypothetical protein HMPREF1548_02413 [Clostridium sp. KLE 1755]
MTKKFIPPLYNEKNLPCSIKYPSHSMWRRSACYHENCSKSKGSAILEEKWMCVSVSAE